LGRLSMVFGAITLAGVPGITRLRWNYANSFPFGI
jgi:hypothetical protein